MSDRRPHQIIICAFTAILLVSCTKQPSALEQAQKIQCHDDSTLESNHLVLVKIQQSYCTAVLSNLAPRAPEGITSLWTRENPYPALPDYYLYPDTSPMQINAKRLQKVASCMHKRCLKLTQDPKSYCGAPECIQNEGDTILATFQRLSQICTAEPYTQRRIVENIRNIYQTREGQPIQLCDERVKGNQADLKMAFGQRVDACLPNQNQCPVGYVCTPEAIGHRCRVLKPLPAPEIPGIEFPTTQERQSLGSTCSLSSECQHGLVCGLAAGAYAVCSVPCDETVKCPKLHHCYNSSDTVSFCTESCDPRLAPKRALDKNTDRLCIQSEGGGRYIDMTSAQLTAMVQSAGAARTQKDGFVGPDPAVDTLIRSFDTSRSCGNGILEPPEQCDLGTGNGEPKLGAWCTTSCSTAECGNNIREAGEACECTTGYEQAFAKNEELSRIYQLPTTCPGRHAITDGSEKALGFACHNCSIVHGRHMRDTRQNPYFLPEFDPFNPPDDNPPSGAKLPE